MKKATRAFRKLCWIIMAVAGAQFFSSYSEAQIKEDEGVIVDNKKSAFLPYLQRRTTWGVLFSAQLEQYFPKDYFSLIQLKYYDEIGGAVSLGGAELGLKYNFSLGSVAALASYSAGTTSDSNRGLNRFSVSLTKVSANLTLDAFMNEPWVAPYVQGGMHQFNILEESTVSGTTSSESPKIDWNFNYRAGILIQLNWLEKSIDPNTHAEGLRSSGLENTYLDIFYSEYMRPSKVAESANEEGEPDHASSHFGVGLKMEF
jgi:hypothetical protein